MKRVSHENLSKRVVLFILSMFLFRCINTTDTTTIAINGSGIQTATTTSTTLITIPPITITVPTTTTTLPREVNPRVWTRQFGTTGLDVAMSIALTHSTGAVHVTGYTYGNLDGNMNAGGADIFLIQYDASGAKLWTRQLGTENDDAAYGIAVDYATGAVYVTGETRGNLDGNTNAGGADLFLTKYDASGTKLWTRLLGSENDDAAYGIAVDQTTGAIYLAGETRGNLDGNTNAGFTDSFLAQYDASGMRLWTRQLGTENDDAAYGIAVDYATGSIYVTGETQGSLDGNTNTGGADLFLTRYDASGIRQWTRQLGSANSDRANGIAVNAATDTISVTGYTEGDLDGNTNAGEADAFLTGYDRAGTKLWTRLLGSSAPDKAYGVAMDSATGAIFMIGETWGGLDGSTNLGFADLFLTRYDTFGMKQWTRLLGSTSSDIPYGVAVDPATGAVYMAGETQGSLNGNMNSGLTDLFLIKE